MLPTVLVAKTALLTACFSLPAKGPPTRRAEVQLSKDIKFVIENQPFDPSKHDVSQCNKRQPCVIDDRPAYGMYDSLPTIEPVSIHVVIGGRRIELDSSGMFNTISPVEDRAAHVWLSDELYGRTLVRGEFSDGAATYRVEWMVVGNTSIRTTIKCAECFSMACGSFRAPPKTQ